jgi:hypothetical protein
MTVIDLVLLQVIDFCDTSLSPYTAVATFTGAGYPSNGLAGVFVGCTSSTVKVTINQSKFYVLVYIDLSVY